MASYGSDHEKIQKLKLNHEYLCEIKRPRNIKFHRKFFALINMVVKNSDQELNVKQLRSNLIISAGYFDLVTGLDGIERAEAQSISFASMKEDEFEELYNKVIDVIIKYFNFDDKQTIKDNIEQYF